MQNPHVIGRVAPWVLPPLVFVLSVSLWTPLASGWLEFRDVPHPSHGDIVFYVDVVTFYQNAQENREEIYCTVPNQQIKFVDNGGLYEGRLRYRVRLFDQDGNPAAAVDKTLEVSAASSEDAIDRGVVQVFQSTAVVPPGKYTAVVSLEDLNAVKRSIMALLFRKHKRGDLEVEIDSQRFPADQLSISDIEFARSLRIKPEGGFQKSGFEVIPNAQRRYGLLLPEMAVFFEVYDFREAGPGDTLSAVYSIINKEGAEIFRDEEPLVARGQRFGTTALFDVTSLAAGSYMLSLTVSDSSGRAVGSSERRFDVVWSVLSWGKYEAEMLEEMTYVLTEREMEEFSSLSPGEQEEFMTRFWREIDPTPGTVENEAMEEHYRRIRYADQHFGGALTRGALSDRGRIYIKYGRPDDQQSFYSDYEFVKGTREAEGGTTPVPTDPFSRVGLKAGSGDVESGITGSDLEMHSDQRGGSTVHGKGYEIWHYDGSGDPVRRLSKRVPTSPAMRFIFVDEKGNGEYKIVYSTEKQEY